MTTVFTVILCTAFLSDFKWGCNINFELQNASIFPNSFFVLTKASNAQACTLCVLKLRNDKFSNKIATDMPFSNKRVDPSHIYKRCYVWYGNVCPTYFNSHHAFERSFTSHRHFASKSHIFN